MQTILQDGEVNKEPKVFVAVRIPKSLDRAIETIAFHRECRKQEVVEEALRAYLANGAAA